MCDDDAYALENGARLVQHDAGEIGTGGAALCKGKDRMTRNHRDGSEDDHESETDAYHLLPFTDDPVGMPVHTAPRHLFQRKTRSERTNPRPPMQRYRGCRSPSASSRS